jgi:hypothetical protein
MLINQKDSTIIVNCTTKNFELHTAFTKMDQSMGPFKLNRWVHSNLDNAITLMHDGVFPNTHMRGSSQINFPLTSAGLRECIEKVGILDNSVLHSDHRGMFLDLNSRLLGKRPEKVMPHQFRTLKLDDPRLSDAYRRILHKHFEEHNVFG